MFRNFACGMAAVAALCLAHQASAIVEYRTTAEITAQAQKIVIGDVIDVSGYWDDNLIKSQVTVQVSDYLLGSGFGQEVLHIHGGTVGDTTLNVSVFPKLQEGDHVLLFIGDTPTGLVECFQGAYLTDGVTIARTAPSCGRVIDASRQSFESFLDEIADALPHRLPRVHPYQGDYQVPTASSRFGLCGYDWTYKTTPMGEDYKINPNCSDSSAGDAASQILQIQNGMDTWHAAGADFQYTYGGTTSQDYVSNNSTNAIYWTNSPGGSYIAANYHWVSGGSMTGSDIEINDQGYTWWNGAGGCTGMDIWSIMAHELGHTLCLADLYGGGDSQKTMYGYGSNCQTFQRTLHTDDIAGIISIYGAGTFEHCAASGGGDEYISGVEVGSISNTGTGENGYVDYTAMSTSMLEGVGHPITVTNGNGYPEDQCGIWVDWNRDYDFDDANETISVSGNPGEGPYTATITPPAGVTNGDSVMRVRITYTGAVDPCGTTQYGEVEDYTIVVDDGTTIGACCYGLTCGQATSAYCAANDGIFMGGGTNCSPNPCLGNGGECCYPDGTCAFLIEGECVAGGGTWGGTGSDCDPNLCPQPQGACCLFDGSCVVGTEGYCASQGGTYQGPLTDCNPNNCPQPAGACCFGDGSCLLLTDVDCAAQGGNFSGSFTSCVPNLCPQPSGACCYADGSCVVSTDADCVGAGGTWSGMGTNCNPNLCPQPDPDGACCYADGSCADLTEANCNGGGGAWEGAGTLCASTQCPQPGCPEDLDGLNGVGQGDLNAVLNRWGDPACDPGGAAHPCPEDLDGLNGVGQGDLNAVLNRWGDPDCD